nr:Dihydrofolate reductase [uncultured bacterium]
MPISAIVAMAENRVIGKNNQLPWRLPADLRHFKALTMGKPILMGRKTHESIGRVLPGRQNIITTRNTAFQVPEALVVHSLEAALKTLPETEEVMLIGGAELYRELFPKVQRIYMTLVHAEVEGDSYFPELKPSEWQQISCEDHEADQDNAYPYSFLVWERL